jgi:hypothetical protein
MYLATCSSLNPTPDKGSDGCAARHVIRPYRHSGRVRSIHMQAPVHWGASRTDSEGRRTEDAVMKKRLVITGIVFAALLLALYGVVFGTGAD